MESVPIFLTAICRNATCLIVIYPTVWQSVRDLPGHGCEEQGLIQSRLDGANFTLTDCSKGDFSGSSLKGTGFRGSLANLCTFTDCDFSPHAKASDWVGAVARGSDFTRANFLTAILVGGDFCESIFTGASFTDANLNSANFSRAINPPTLVTSG